MAQQQAGSLQGKICLLTGASGIAAATARLAVERGARVYFVSNVTEQCEALAGELRETGAICDFRVADLTIEEQVAQTIQGCVESYGRIDMLFHVVGISGRRFGDGPIHECSTDGWEVTMRANATTAFLVCREGVRQMLKQPVSEAGLRGSILNMSSVLAFAPEPDNFATHAYAASKGAVLSMTKSMAAYYAPHKIRVNAIAPGLTRTPMSARAQENQDILNFIRYKQPLSEDLIEAEDVARAALFLLSDESRYMTGEVLAIDGGWHLRG
ncbi:MAG: SDR family NAD(P)-dependent oxidoreductase [Blastocatellia bacterium]